MKNGDKLLPPEPPASVRAVRDRDGDLWTRRSDGGWATGSPESGYDPMIWPRLADVYGPLTVAATVEPIVVTRAMGVVGYETYCEAQTGLLEYDFAAGMKAALESAGIPCEIKSES